MPAVEQLLKNLPGIAAIRLIPKDILERLVALEGYYESAAFLPTSNPGIPLALKRDLSYAILKDRTFRAPPEPTVYLVEEMGPGKEQERRTLSVAGRRYRIIGEEVLESRKPYAEKTIYLAKSFVIFPDRRSNPKTPSYFLMPPLSFPELEERREDLGIANIISISPSAQGDRFLREACGFPPDTSLATLLVCFSIG